MRSTTANRRKSALGAAKPPPSEQRRGSCHRFRCRVNSGFQAEGGPACTLCTSWLFFSFSFIFFICYFYFYSEFGFFFSPFLFLSIFSSFFFSFISLYFQGMAYLRTSLSHTHIYIFFFTIRKTSVQQISDSLPYYFNLILASPRS